MNKSQLVEAVMREANLSKVEACRAVDAVLHTTIRCLRDGDKLTLTGLGTFLTVRRPERTGRNPRTGAAVRIAARRVVKFRPTLTLEE